MGCRCGHSCFAAFAVVVKARLGPIDDKELRSREAILVDIGILKRIKIVWVDPKLWCFLGIFIFW